VGTAQTLLFILLGVAVGGYVAWWSTAAYYQTEPSAREKALWRRLAELQALMKVPPTFWAVWERYIREQPRLSTTSSPAPEKAPGRHAAPEPPTQPGDDTRPDRERE
jgi:hypothetical protein